MYYPQYTYYHNDWQEWERQTQQLLRDIEKAATDEFQAVQYYSKLAQLAPNQQVKQMILAIRQDEISHLNMFTKSYFELTKQYPDLVMGKLPESFAKGVQESMLDEQQTVPFYRGIASRTTNQQVQRRFIRASNDEQRHYEIFRKIASQLNM